MGNNATRESRGLDSASSPTHRHPDSAAGNSQPASPTERVQAPVYSSRTARGNRADLSFLGIGSSANNEGLERRETKQEREARKLEKERQNRLKERERSLKEEHVDGGYLVTMGVYTGIEDYSKLVVRQLMIERRMAPFWRGLNDFSESWTEHQLVAAGRGLPIPAADYIPPDVPLSPESTHPSNQNLQSLMVPITSRSHSAASDGSATLSPSHPAFTTASASSVTSPPPQASSAFRPRSKTLASLTNAAKSTGTTDVLPREIQLPQDPHVNGQAIEVFLYKDATECPICFLSYPPYLNKTRCCDQLICSECFVQIKRPDPHTPEHHDPADSANPSPAEATADAEALVSEPACCPYCQQAEFGVTYDPPPFRRGLGYANILHGLGSFASAMSSTSSINSTTPPGSAPLSPGGHKRRTTSISANASTVITTDRVRPDWATKLANARSHLARRSAAATALHTAAYLMNGTQDTRGFGFRSSRLARSRGESSSAAAGAGASSSGETGARAVSEQLIAARREAAENGGSRRRGRIEDLEEMMMMEAIRLSLAAEEERKRKADKEAAKEAKKAAKAEKKREKKERKGIYGSGASSANGSTMSLNLPGLGRRRGNSSASMLQKEVTSGDVEPLSSKGKAVDRSAFNSPFGAASSDLPGNSSSGRHLDNSPLEAVDEDSQPSSIPKAPGQGSHVRHMSNASSPASSFVDSVGGSLRNAVHARGSNSSLVSPDASRNHLASHSDATPDEGDAQGSAEGESMFNFQSLAAMIGQEDEEAEKDAARHIEYLGESSGPSNSEAHGLDGLEESVATLKVEQNPNGRQASSPGSQRSNPDVMVTPETPAGNEDEDGKQLGAGWVDDRASRAITS